MAQQGKQVRASQKNIISPASSRLSPDFLRRLIWPRRRRKWRNFILYQLRRNMRAGLDVILPPLCVSCRTGLVDQNMLCVKCWREIDFIAEPLCDRSGMPLPYDYRDGGNARFEGQDYEFDFAEQADLSQADFFQADFSHAERHQGKLISAAALKYPPPYGRARAVAAYTGVMRQLIHDFKYRDRFEARALFARWMESAGAELLQDADLLLPVPLYRARLWQRRYNQAAILAQALAERSHIPVEPTVLKRVKRTQSQVGLTAAQRRKNVSGAFALKRGGIEKIRGRHIVLIDDVLTTGATVDACSKLLLKAGAAGVDVITLARVVRAEI